MKLFRNGNMKRSSCAVFTLAAILGVAPVFAQPQNYPPPPPSYPPQELDRMVSRIALYPDSLLAQVLAAATFYDQIPDAARWADQHHYLQGDALAAAISGDRLPWDPSVQALLPFPSVLEHDGLGSELDWPTTGNAFLSQQQQVMDAVQRERRKARDYGYLRSNPQIVVSNGPYIEIAPVNPGFIVVPVYNPLVVFAPPRPGFFVGGAINFGFGISIGAAFRPWGWGYNRFGWANHSVIINNANWNRNWANRTAYVHPYAGVARGPAFRPGVHVEEHHELHERSPRERENARVGHAREEEHREEHHR